MKEVIIDSSNKYLVSVSLYVIKKLNYYIKET